MKIRLRFPGKVSNVAVGVLSSLFPRFLCEKLYLQERDFFPSIRRAVRVRVIGKINLDPEFAGKNCCFHRLVIIARKERKKLCLL